MTDSHFCIVPLGPNHDRLSFKSSSEPLNRYLYKQVTQDMRRRITACFVLLSEQRIVGYYTLSSASLLLSDLPDVATPPKNALTALLTE